ncbi:unnamed protein product [Ambrosiozyma monospora]|uniref:Unnamed protein product n=1 Tax=Ambrosiozyma monospora TaxID=43982 RepID=A0ACB5SU78_AMBMO|nr:unnamed protein product [Ambrosiozyma monospora]
MTESNPEANSESQTVRIRPLDKSVVNKIAAGEIIIAPANAIKELLENSIDAGSTTIDITIKDGGLKQITITDNGSGINKDDLPILCERFTTSKLSKFEDLQSIATYGFRGEALASISQISHLTVITKTKNEPTAWKAQFTDGMLNKNGAKPVAGKNGTSLIIEDLFYNVKSRLRALRGGNEEYLKIVDVVNRYSVHSKNVGFTIKKTGSNSNDLIIRPNLNTKDRIKVIYGSSVANDLIDLSLQANLDVGLFKCEGMITNSNYYNNKKRIQPIFFINNRLVACDPLKRAINQVYSSYLPKGHTPFIYLALELDPVNVDVNVHPTKREVRFLHEDEVIDYIVRELEAKLSSLDSSRKFTTQQVLLPKRKLDDELQYPQQSQIGGLSQPESSQRPRKQFKPISSFKKPNENKLVRTDFRQQTLSSQILSNSNIRSSQFSQSQSQFSQRVVNSSLSDIDVSGQDSSMIGEGDENDNEQTLANTTVQTIEKERVKVNLLSVNNLRSQVENFTSEEITNILSHHTFIGVIDYEKRLVALQSGLKLFMVDYASICNELFYQIGLSDFANFGKLKLSEPISIRKQLEVIYNNADLLETVSKGNKVKTIDEVLEKFSEMGDMLNEYFSIEVDEQRTKVTDVNLISLPMLIQNYFPSLSKLPLFLFRVGNRVNWEDEQECLGGILRQLALFYVPASVPNEDKFDPDRAKMELVLRDLLFPLIKKRILGTENLIRDVVELANLPGLYKVFERC